MNDQNLINDIRARYGKFPPRDIADLLNVAQRQCTNYSQALADVERLRAAMRAIAEMNDWLAEYDNLLDFDSLDDVHENGIIQGRNEAASIARKALGVSTMTAEEAHHAHTGE